MTHLSRVNSRTTSYSVQHPCRSVGLCPGQVTTSRAVHEDRAYQSSGDIRDKTLDWSDSTCLFFCPRICENDKNRQHFLPTLNLRDPGEHEELDQGVDSHGNGNANTTKHLGTGTLPERGDTLPSKDLAASVDKRIVLEGLECAGQCLKAPTVDL
jgi:hypothetical protein